MDEPMRNALQGILEDYGQRRNREDSARKAEQAGQEKFLVDATVALNSIVAPRFGQAAKTFHDPSRSSVAARTAHVKLR